MNTPGYLPVLVPALGLLVPFLIRWIENRSRLRQAAHLLEVIRTRDEIARLLGEPEEENPGIPENEILRLRYYHKELEKEITRNESFGIRLYPVLVSVEMIFFVSAIFSGAIRFLERLIYAQGNETLPFLEGIFSDARVRIFLLIACLLLSLFLTHSYQKRIVMRQGISLRSELRAFGAFNLFFLGIILLTGLVLYLLDLIMPWF